MTTSTSAEWSESPDENEHRLRTLAFALEGLLVGLLAGMGAFAYNMIQFVALDVDAQLLLVPVAGAGVFAHLFAPTLRRSIRLGLAGFCVGLVVIVAAWIAPLWIAADLPAPRDALLPELAGNAITAAFLNYAPTYLGGYLLAVSTAAFWE